MDGEKYVRARVTQMLAREVQRRGETPRAGWHIVCGAAVYSCLTRGQSSAAPPTWKGAKVHLEPAWSVDVVMVTPWIPETLSTAGMEHLGWIACPWFDKEARIEVYEQLRIDGCTTVMAKELAEMLA